MGLLIFYLLLALGVSFLCSVMEAVILSVTYPFIKSLEAQGKSKALMLKRLKDKIDRPLSAILSINTVAHTIGAAGVGAQAVAIFGEVYFGLISAILTIMILVISEIIPKTIGANFWRELALPSAVIIRGMIFISYPLVVFSEYLTRIFSKNVKSQVISREEVALLAHLGAEEGVFHESESKIINNLIKLNTIKARSIVTPRTVVVAAPEDMLLVDFIKNESFLKHSRIPIYKENIDNITGYILKDDVLEKVANDTFNLRLIELKRPVLVYYENASVPTLFEKLLLNKDNFAVVVDEYGGMKGIVTMEDIIETILGLEIMDEKDIVPNMQQLARMRWELRTKKMNLNLDNLRKSSKDKKD